MANGKIQLSLSDLFKGIVHEFSVALALIRRSHPEVRVHSVRVNIGQSGEEQLPEDEASAALILPDRYPGIDKEWLLQVELGEGSAARVQGVPRPLSAARLPTALDLFGEQPLSAIKGIDRKWSRIFAAYDIRQIGQLARIEEPVLAQLIDAGRSLRPREFRRKALLLDSPIPALPKTGQPAVSLYDALQLTPLQLQTALDPRRVSRAEIASLLDLLEVVCLVIDSSLLRKISLPEFLDS